ncbi:NUDIX domain-containing protein [Candidatus Pacearchaeota archaeon]|jgi:8-oxo-dGTP diphosphatase|nr:NUDIX domain-containing protein [Candidatus Pacearchaeota archaeon]
MVTKIRLVKALVRYNGKYLLLRKSEDKFFPENIGKWECSGGLVKMWESPEKAIAKELATETGLEFNIVKKLPTLTMKDEKYYSHCDIYLIEASSDKVNLSDKHSEYQWVSAEEVKNVDLVLYANLLLEFFNNPKKYLD